MLSRLFSTSLLAKRITVSSEITYEGNTVKITSISDLDSIEQYKETLIIDDSTKTGTLGSHTAIGKFKKIVIKSPVTALDSNLFTDNKIVTDVTLPDSLKTLKSSQFQRTPIKNINLENIETFGSRCFQNCPFIETMTIKANIPNYFAYHCVSLKEVKLIEMVSISEFAFAYCPSLQTIDFEKITSIGDSSFAYSGIKGATLTNQRVGERAFAESDLEKITFKTPSSVQIDSKAFEGTNIKNVEIPLDSNSKYDFQGCILLETATITSTDTFTIPKNMFSGCYSLKTVTALKATAIGANAFYNCSSLQTLKTDTIVSVGKYAFQYCENLEFTVDSSLVDIGAYAFYYCRKVKITNYNQRAPERGDVLDLTSAFEGCTSITSIVVNTSLYNSQFRCCTALESVTILDPATSIGQYCFANCTKLNKLTITHTETNPITLNVDAFAYTTALTTVTLNNVTANEKAFYFSGLKEITIGNTDFSDNVFFSCTNLEKVTVTSDCNQFNPLAFYNLTKITFEFKNGEFLKENGGIVTRKVIGIDKNYSVIEFILPSYSKESFALSGDYDGVTRGAFHFAENVKEISITKKTEKDISLGYSRYLKELSISNSNYSEPLKTINNFCYECINLKTLKIEKAVTKIGANAFQSCYSLKDVTLPDEIDIGDSAFASCTSLKSITIPLIFEDTSEDNRNNKQLIFSGCTSLKSVEFHPRQSKIFKYMFPGCGFKEFTVPDSITSIGTGAFMNCDKLSKFYFGKGMTSLSNLHNNFYGNYVNLTFYIPAEVTTIKSDAFLSFGYIDVKIDDENRFYYAKDNCIINKLTNALVTTFGVLDKVFTVPKDVEFVDGRIYIGNTPTFSDAANQKFQNVRQLRVLKLSSNVKTMEPSGASNDIQIRSVCYDGKYFMGTDDSRTSFNFYVSKNYIFPRNSDKCQYDYTYDDKVRHVIGMTGPEIGLTVFAVIIGIILILAIIIYFIL